MRTRTVLALGASGLLLLQGCAQVPTGPLVQVMPGPNKPFEAFQQDQGYCKQYAASQVAGEAERANQRGLGAALLTTVLGVGLGAAAGGGYGAGVGAAGGAAVGAAAGGGGAGGSQALIQYRYDVAYMQCMYARGNQVPGFQSAAVVAAPPVYGY